jgi:hypothetical protein
MCTFPVIVQQGHTSLTIGAAKFTCAAFIDALTTARANALTVRLQGSYERTLHNQRTHCALESLRRYDPATDERDSGPQDSPTRQVNPNLRGRVTPLVQTHRKAQPTKIAAAPAAYCVLDTLQDGLNAIICLTYKIHFAPEGRITSPFATPVYSAALTPTPILSKSLKRLAPV